MIYSFSHFVCLDKLHSGFWCTACLNQLPNTPSITLIVTFRYHVAHQGLLAGSSESWWQWHSCLSSLCDQRPWRCRQTPCHNRMLWYAAYSTTMMTRWGYSTKYSMWNVHTAATTTNNAIKGWHSRLNRAIGCSHPNTYELLTVLKMEQATIALTLARADKGAPPPTQRRKYRDLDARLDRLRGEYRNGQMATDDYLSALGHLVHHYWGLPDCDKSPPWILYVSSLGVSIHSYCPCENWWSCLRPVRRWVSVYTHTAPVRTGGLVCGQCSAGCQYPLILPLWELMVLFAASAALGVSIHSYCPCENWWSCLWPVPRWVWVSTHTAPLWELVVLFVASAALGVSIHSYCPCENWWSCLRPVQRWVSVLTHTAPVRTDGPVCGQCGAGCQYTLILPLWELMVLFVASAALGVSIDSYRPCENWWSCLRPVRRWVSVSTHTAPVRTDGLVCGQCSAGCQYPLILNPCENWWVRNRCFDMQCVKASWDLEKICQIAPETRGNHSPT